MSDVFSGEHVEYFDTYTFLVKGGGSGELDVYGYLEPENG